MVHIEKDGTTILVAKCVCVCEREREREKRIENSGKRAEVTRKWRQLQNEKQETQSFDCKKTSWRQRYRWKDSMKIDLNNYTKYKVKRGSCSIALVVM
jgi:hypothetical protein